MPLTKVVGILATKTIEAYIQEQPQTHNWCIVALDVQQENILNAQANNGPPTSKETEHNQLPKVLFGWNTNKICYHDIRPMIDVRLLHVEDTYSHWDHCIKHTQGHYSNQVINNHASQHISPIVVVGQDKNKYLIDDLVVHQCTHNKLEICAC